MEANINEKERLLAREDADFGGSELEFSGIEADDNDDNEIDVINDCDSKTYYGVTFTFLFCIVSAALALDDLSLIFGMIAAFSESMLNFVLPGLFFLTGLAYVGIESIFLRIIASMFTFLGLTYFVTSNYFNYIKLMRVM